MSGNGYILNYPQCLSGNTFAVPQVDPDGSHLRMRRFPTVGAASEAAGLIALNIDNADLFTITLTASGWTFSNPTWTGAASVIDGGRLQLLIKQDGTGGRTVLWGTAFRFSTDLPSPTLSTGINITDRLGFMFNAAVSKWDFVSLVRGYA